MDTKIAELLKAAQQETSGGAMLAFCQAVCRENTGSALCDSGGAYGYIYNSANKAEAVDAGNLSISTAHHLEAVCSVDGYAYGLNRRFEKFSQREDQQDNGWMGCLEDFLSYLAERGEINFDGHLDSPEVANSYNWDNDLDQVLQFAIFSHTGSQGFWKHELQYVAVQVHTGCDVMGGYTRPYFLKLRESGGADYFLDMQLRGYLQEDGAEDLESAYQIEEAAEFKDGRWVTPEGAEVCLSATAYGV